MKLKSTHWMVLLTGLLLVAINSIAAETDNEADTSVAEDTLRQNTCWHSFVLTNKFTPCYQTEVSKVKTKAFGYRQTFDLYRATWLSRSLETPKYEPNANRFFWQAWDLNQTGLRQIDHGSSPRIRRSYRVIRSR